MDKQDYIATRRRNANTVAIGGNINDIVALQREVIDLRDRLSRLGALALLRTGRGVKDSDIDWGQKHNQVKATRIPIVDSGDYFNSTTVEDALQELASETVNSVTVERSLGKATGAYTELGSFAFDATGKPLVLVVSISVQDNGFRSSKKYNITVRPNQTSGAWQIHRPINSTGELDPDYDLEIFADSTECQLRYVNKQV